MDWVGSLPSHWNMLPLKRSFQIFGGSTPKSGQAEYWEGDVPWATPSDLSDLKSLYLTSTRRTITQSGLESCGTNLVPAGTVVLSTRAPIGSVAITGIALCTNQGCRSLVPLEGADSKFFAYMLSISSGELNIRGKGTTFLELSGDELAKFEVPVPPLEEQKAIAAFLDRETSKIDALVAEQRRLIELLQEKRQAVISHAVTKGLNPGVRMKPSGIPWIGDLPEHWATPPMFARYNCVLGKMLDEKKLTRLHPIHYLRNADVNWDWINVQDLPVFDIEPDEFDRFALRPGDILICEGGAGIGQTAIWRGQLERCAFQKALHRLRPWSHNNENPKFFYYCMRYVVETGIVLAGGTATIPHLTGEELRKYRFPTPPKEEQDRIVEYLDQEVGKLVCLMDEAGRAISLLQERRTALISAAVTGKIDVSASCDAPSLPCSV